MNTFKTKSPGLPEKGSTVVVGLSGGVDSSVTALLLKEHGCRVIGVTMSSWANDLPLPASTTGARFSCYGPDEAIDIEQCKNFCASQNIDYHVIDVRDAYRKHVLDYFKAEYRSGLTPNPCVHCNATVKFGALLDGVRAKGIDFDYFCTGHYAHIVQALSPIHSLYNESSPSAPDSSYDEFPTLIACADDATKDQAYFLHRIPASVLQKVRFPLANFTKAKTIALAKEKELAAASRSESQDFIPSDYFDIIFSDKKFTGGDIVDLNGNKLGTHRGIEHYTVGQRRGLGVSSTQPLYVHSINKEKNTVVLSEADALLSHSLTANNWVWAGNYAPTKEFSAKVKIRLASPACSARIIPGENAINREYTVCFENPQKAIAPGQSVVVYINDIIAGGGIIVR